MRVPPGAFPECAALEKANFGPRPALDARATSLVEMRKAVNAHEEEITALKAELEALKSRPF